MLTSTLLVVHRTIIQVFVGSDALKDACQVLADDTHFLSVSFAHNLLTKPVSDVAELMEKNTTIRKLDLRGCFLCVDGERGWGRGCSAWRWS